MQAQSVLVVVGSSADPPASLRAVVEVSTCREKESESTRSSPNTEWLRWLAGVSSICCRGAVSASHMVAWLTELASSGTVGGRGEEETRRDPEESGMSSELARSPPLVSRGDWEAGEVARGASTCSIWIATSEVEETLDALRV